MKTAYVELFSFVFNFFIKDLLKIVYFYPSLIELFYILIIYTCFSPVNDFISFQPAFKTYHKNLLL